MKLKGNEAAIGTRVKVSLYANGRLASTVIVRIGDSGDAGAEFETIDGSLSVIVQDTGAGVQLDNAPVKKSTSRDLDDLF